MRPSASSAAPAVVAFGGGAALSEAPASARLSRVRFGGNDDVPAQGLGSLILTSRNDPRRGVPGAVERAGELPAGRGRVVGCTTDDVSLVAKLDDALWVRGEATIAVVRRHIRRRCIRPESARSAPPARNAMEAFV